MNDRFDLADTTILLVEDDLLIRQDIMDTLGAYGASIIATGHLEEAIELVEGPVSHAVLDVKLEDGNVHPVARRLAERDIPFTFYSSAARCTGLADAFPGAIVLEKPVLAEKLAAIIHRSTSKEAHS